MSTEIPDTPAPEPSVAPSRESPGALIREARQRMSLSLDDLAGQTKLTRHTLDALERDDFTALLEPVYVRGYYRKCAKVLGLQEQRLLDAYGQRVMPKTVQPPAKLRLASGTELGSGSRLPVALAVGLAVAAVVICGFVWMARDGGNPQGTPVTTVVVPSTSVEVPVEIPPATAAMPDPALTPAGESAPPAAPVPADASAPVPAAPADPLSAPLTAAPAPAAVGGQGTIGLRFSGTSWVRVDDAGGKVLLRGEFADGESRTVQGAAPLNLHLGNASVVTVLYQGQTVDFSSQLRSNGTARFTLPLGSP